MKTPTTIAEETLDECVVSDAYEVITHELTHINSRQRRELFRWLHMNGFMLDTWAVKRDAVGPTAYLNVEDDEVEWVSKADRVTFDERSHAVAMASKHKGRVVHIVRIPRPTHAIPNDSAKGE